MPRSVGAGVDDGVGEGGFVNGDGIGRFGFDEVVGEVDLFDVGFGLEIDVDEPGFGLDEAGVGFVH